MASRGLHFCVSSTSFQKSSIDWPQQPLTEKVLKFNLTFHDSTPKNVFSKHQNKADFKNLDDSEVPSCDFPGLIISVASMTSTASFHQKLYWSWWFDDPWHQNDQYWSIFVEWIIKNPIFTDFSTFSVRGCWGQPVLLFWKLIHETQNLWPPEATRHNNKIIDSFTPQNHLLSDMWDTL